MLRAFEAGWGGVVWKTLGSQVKNVSSRYSSVDYGGQRVMGFNNIELISDRPLDINLKEIEECIRLFPDRAMIVSLMADNDRQSWHELIKKVEEIAKQKGCGLIHLDSFDWQAKDFYLKHGYEVFGILDDCPPGHKRYYMKKIL